MKRTDALRILAGGLLVTPAIAATEADKFQAEFKQAWKRSRDYTITVFSQMPEEHLNFKPMPEMFSFRMQFVHSMVYTTGQLAGRMGLKDPYETAEGWTKRSKADIVTELGKFYDWVETSVLALKPEQLNKMQDFVGDQITGRQLCYGLENHIIHHRGQAIVYLRLKGITPEPYFGW